MVSRFFEVSFHFIHFPNVMEDFLNSQKDTYKLNVERELFKSQNVRFNFDSIKFLIPLCATSLHTLKIKPCACVD